MKFLSVVLLGSCVIFAPPAKAAPGDVTEADRKFLAEVVAAVSRKDAAWIVMHSNLPMALVAGDKRRILEKEEYTRLVSQALTDSFCARFQSEAKKDLFKNWRGVMIGDGILWFTQVGARGVESWT
jgi:hypothetical protein